MRVDLKIHEHGITAVHKCLEHIRKTAASVHCRKKTNLRHKNKTQQNKQTSGSQLRIEHHIKTRRNCHQSSATLSVFKELPKFP